MDTLYFASIYGGDIAVREDKEKGLIPEDSLYRIKFEPIDNHKLIPRVVRGMMYIEGEARSFAFRTYDLIAAVLIRESGF